MKHRTTFVFDSQLYPKMHQELLVGCLTDGLIDWLIVYSRRV